MPSIGFPGEAFVCHFVTKFYYCQEIRYLLASFGWRSMTTPVRYWHVAFRNTDPFGNNVGSSSSSPSSSSSSSPSSSSSSSSSSSPSSSLCSRSGSCVRLPHYAVCLSWALLCHMVPFLKPSLRSSSKSCPLVTFPGGIKAIRFCFVGAFQ